MAALCTFFKRAVAQNSSNNHNTATRDSSCDTASFIPIDRSSNPTNDIFTDLPTLGLLNNNHHDLSKSPSLNVSSKNRRQKRFQRSKHNIMTMNNQQEHQLIDHEICLIDRILPKELLLRIFSFLDYQSLCRCAQVSKYWNLLALDGSNWQNINLKTFQRDINGIVLENLSFRCGAFLRQLNIENCKYITDHNMSVLADRCPNLERLNFKHCEKLSNITLLHLSKHCSYINYLNISSCSQINDQGIKMISSNCLQLECWDMSWCMNITEDGIRILAESCPKLTIFRAEGCANITNQALIHLSKNCRNLTFVDLNRCSTLTDHGLIELVQSCHLIETLIIANCASLTDNTLITIGKNCPRLKKLDATLCSQFTDNGLLAITQGCPLLQRIDLEDCTAITDETLRHLAENCPNLKILTLSRCEQITDEGIRHISSSINVQDNLRVLELDNCPLITDISIDHLLLCQNLQRLDIFDCQQITKNAIKKIQIRSPNLKVHAYFAPRTPPLTRNQTVSCSTCVPSCCAIA